MSTTDTDNNAVTLNPNSTDTSTVDKSKATSWNAADPTDGRKFYEYESKYPCHIRVQIFAEALYLVLILFLSFYVLFWIFSSDFALYPSSLKISDLNDELIKIVAFGIAGLIGGSMFGLKYLYHVTARGLWHQDRRIWRIYSPWLAASLAMMIGLLIDGGLFDIHHTQTNQSKPYSSFISIGFITGYFADTALAKLQEIATVVFGSSSRGSANSEK